MESIEKKLLQLFARQSEEEMLDTILQIFRGIYVFNDPDMDKIDYEEMLLHLEHLAESTTGINEHNTLDEDLNLMLQFVNVVKDTSYKKIEENEISTIGHDILNKPKKLFKGEITTRVISFLLALSIASGIYYNAQKDNKKDSGPKIDRATYGITLESDDTLANGVDFVNTVSDVINGDTSLEEAKKGLSENEITILTHVVEAYNSNTSLEGEIETLSLEDISDDSTNTETIEEETEITLDDQINSILEEYNLTYEEFDVLAAIVMGECKNGDYIDAYAVINTIYNRTISSRWVRYANKYYDDESYSTNLYYQATLSGQFSAYENGRYEQFLGVRDIESFYAVVDFLTTKNMLHDYLSFRSEDTVLTEEQAVDATTFADGGNQYFNALPVEERINDSVESFSRQ